MKATILNEIVSLHCLAHELVTFDDYETFDKVLVQQHCIVLYIPTTPKDILNSMAQS
jgi:hypothetical protein